MTERVKDAAGFLRPTHNGIEEPHRRQWSVLCYRGWCDPEFKADDIVTMVKVISGHELPRIVRPAACPTPGTCQCKCHDNPATLPAGTDRTENDR